MESDPLYLPKKGWLRDPEFHRSLGALRQHRDILVPDTVEWSGKPPKGAEWTRWPVPFVTPNGWRLKLPCRDEKGSRTIGTSTCSGLDTPLMPYAEHAWAFLAIAEAAAHAYLRKPQIARVDFARDMRVPDSRAYLRKLVEGAVEKDEIEIYKKRRQLGITYLGVAGGDRLRIYHKGLETRRKHGYVRETEGVIRIELQCRKGQLDIGQRQNIDRLRSARLRPEPREDDIPVMRTKPSPGHGIKRTHLWGMRRARLPSRAVLATEAVEEFLIAQGHLLLVSGHVGVSLPEPLYGETPASDPWGN